MPGLLSDPHKFNLILNGIGLLGSEFQDQSNRHLQSINQGLLQQSRLNQNSAEKKADRKFNQPLQDARTNLINAQIGQAQNPARKTVKDANGRLRFADDLSLAIPDLETTPDQTGAQKDYQLAVSQGFQGSFLDYQTALAEAKRTSIVNNVGGELPFKIPQNMMLIDPADPNKGVKPIPGSTGGQLSGEGAKLEEISRGGAEAVRDLGRIMEEGDLGQGTLAAIEALPNFMLSTDAQQFKTIRADLTDMIGRLRSGGAITQDEEGRFLSLVPVFGDSKETREFKLTRLKSKFENINQSVSLAPTSEDQPVSTGEETLEELIELYGLNE